MYCRVLSQGPGRCGNPSFLAVFLCSFRRDHLESRVRTEHTLWNLPKHSNARSSLSTAKQSRTLAPRVGRCQQWGSKSPTEFWATAVQRSPKGMNPSLFPKHLLFPDHISNQLCPEPKDKGGHTSSVLDTSHGNVQATFSSIWYLGSGTP